jgi:hypothetical protein
MAAVLVVLSLGIIWCVWLMASGSVIVGFYFMPVASPFWIWLVNGLLAAALVLFIWWQRRKQH